MEFYRGYVIGNLMLDLELLAWLLAQLLKVLLNYAFQGKSDFSLLLKSGGMPSSHSAFVCALAVLQDALPGYIRTSKPLQLVLDRRPFL